MKNVAQHSELNFNFNFMQILKTQSKVLKPLEVLNFYSKCLPRKCLAEDGGDTRAIEDTIKSLVDRRREDGNVLYHIAYVKNVQSY